MVRRLHRGDFIDGGDNVVLIGGPGTGKSHIATALGIQAAEHHRKKVRFFSTGDLVNALEQEKAMNKAGQLAERLLRLRATKSCPPSVISNSSITRLMPGASRADRPASSP